MKKICSPFAAGKWALIVLIGVLGIGFACAEVAALPLWPADFWEQVAANLAAAQARTGSDESVETVDGSDLCPVTWDWSDTEVIRRTVAPGLSLIFK